MYAIFSPICALSFWHLVSFHRNVDDYTQYTHMNEPRDIYERVVYGVLLLVHMWPCHSSRHLVSFHTLVDEYTQCTHINAQPHIYEYVRRNMPYMYTVCTHPRVHDSFIYVRRLIYGDFFTIYPPHIYE